MPKAKQNKIADEIKEAEDKPVYIDPKEKQRLRIEAERQDQNKMVRGRFMNHEVPGGAVKFPFRKYPGDQIKTYVFEDGKTYEIPLCVAKHLNENVNYPVHKFTQNKDGRPTMRVGERIQRYSFHSLDFIDTSDPNSLATMGPSTLAEVEIK